MIPLGVLASANARGAPAPPAFDPYWANVVSLLHFDGANNGTTFTDEAGLLAWTAAGGATTTTAAAKYGAGGGQFHPNGARITSSAGIPGGMPGDFTIEAWVYPTDMVVGAIARWATSNRAIYLNTGATVAWYTGTTMNNLTGALSTNTWHHIAVVRQSGSIKVYVDGASTGATYIDSTDLSTAFTVGGDAFNQESKANLDEFRVTKGIARYTSNFSPPSGPFPNS